VYKLSKMTQVL